MRARDLAPVPVGLGLVALLALLLVGPAYPQLLAACAGTLLALPLLLRRHRHAVFVLRLDVALFLLSAGLALAFSPVVLVQALGVAWFGAGLLVALGFLTAWSGLVAGLLLLLGLPIGVPSAAGVALVAFGLALTEDDTLAVDALLRRRGGLFPAFRREVVLERRR